MRELQSNPSTYSQAWRGLGKLMRSMYPHNAVSGPTEEVFQRIWANNYWGDAESRSGGGSNLEQTAVLRPALSRLLSELKIQSMLDLPCGDFHWMKETVLPAGMSYVGGDIVAPLVASNQASFGGPLKRFEQMNLMEDDLPQVDLIFCRDCLVHLSFAQIGKAIENLRRSGSTYLLTTNFSDDRRNHDIRTGQWRPLALRAAPFHFPLPLAVIEEKCTENRGKFSDKTMSLWRIADLPELAL
ncbi:MAG: class I SAM-dependent methyltransferase [Acidobacteria bacterium]|nr:class I SAM-dependent methyltransferase [Acidobacteriota bacterium]